MPYYEYGTPPFVPDDVPDDIQIVDENQPIQETEDRITDILQRRVQQPQQPTVTPQDITLAAEAAMFGGGGAQGIQRILQTITAPQVAQQQAEQQQLADATTLYNMFQEQKQRGDKSALEFDKKLGQFVKNPQDQARIIEYMQNRPDDYDDPARQTIGIAEAMRNLGIQPTPTAGPAPAPMQVAERLTELRNQASQAEDAGDMSTAEESWKQYNELYQAAKLGEKGALVTGEGVTDAPGFTAFLERKEGAKARGKGQEELALKKEESKPIDRFAIRQLDTSQEIIENEINEALDLLGKQSALGRIAFKDIPLTEARALQRSFDTIRANIGFDKLQAMREASKTGGALGQVSEFENKLLQATQGALDEGLRLDALLQNLEQIRTARKQTVLDIKDRFNEYYGEDYGLRERPLVTAEETMPITIETEDPLGIR